MADTTGEAAVPAAVPPALETSAEMTPEPQARGCSGTGTGIPGVTVVKKHGKPTGKYQRVVSTGSIAGRVPWLSTGYLHGYLRR